MSALALPSEETVFWTIAIGLAVVLVLGVFALIVTMLYMVRSISLSMVQLREVVEVQAAQQLAADAPSAENATTEGPSAETSSTEVRAARGDAAGDGSHPDAGSPGGGATPEQGRGGTEEPRSDGPDGGTKDDDSKA